MEVFAAIGIFAVIMMIVGAVWNAGRMIINAVLSLAMAMGLLFMFVSLLGG